MARNTRRAGSAGACLVATVAFFAMAGDAHAQPTCPPGTLIDETLTTGARWQMCWTERAAEGIVFEDIWYQPPGESARRLMKEAGIAQIHVVYDDDRARRHIVTEDGLGAANLADLTPAECPAGTLLSNGSSDVLCQTIAGRGYMYKYYSERVQGYWLELASTSRIGSQTWIARWRFYDDGTIVPAIGATGELTEFGSDPSYGSEVGSGGQIGVGFVTNYYWRFDFDIGSNGADDLVERFEVHPEGSGSTKQLQTSVITQELGESRDPQLKREWRVRDASTTNSDGHAVSYHVEALDGGHAYLGTPAETWASHDVYVTRYDACEKFASQNDTGGGCGGGLGDYLDSESVNGADVVLWYRTTYHHLPRDEDAPYRPTQWRGVILVPRDWSRDNPFSFFGAPWTRQLAMLHLPAPRSQARAR